jgi:hypothetical protein
MVSTDVDVACGQFLEQADVRRVKRRARPWCPSMRRPAPHGPHALEGPAPPVAPGTRWSCRRPGPMHGGDPAWPGVIDTSTGHQRGLVLLVPHSLAIPPSLDGLSPEPLSDLAAEAMAPHLPLRPPLAGLLTEAEGPSEADRFDRAAPGLRALMRPMAPELIVLDERCLRLIGHRASGAASHRGIEHAAAAVLTERSRSRLRTA